jgi:HEPN domain-containing protein
VNRWRGWWDQAARDLRHASHALEDADYEWRAFAAQQAAEKALEGLIMAQGGEPWGHSVTGLVEALPGHPSPDPGLVERPSRLGKICSC